MQQDTQTTEGYTPSQNIQTTQKGQNQPDAFQFFQNQNMFPILEEDGEAAYSTIFYQF